MEKQDIIFWKNKYDKEEILYIKGEEKELRAKFNKNQFMTKQDLIKIIGWKFQGRLKGRQKRILRRIDDVDKTLIEDVSKLAFKTKDEKTKVKLLCIIDGVGASLASVILTFFDPYNYGVFDIHSWRELFGKEPKNLFSNINHLIKFLEKLRDISSRVNLPCRDVEKALFKKNYDNFEKLSSTSV